MYLYHVNPPPCTVASLGKEVHQTKGSRMELSLLRISRGCLVPMQCISRRIFVLLPLKALDVFYSHSLDTVPPETFSNQSKWHAI